MKKTFFAALTVFFLTASMFSFSLYREVGREPSASADSGAGNGISFSAETGTCSDNMTWDVTVGSGLTTSNDTSYIEYTGTLFDNANTSDGLWIHNFLLSTSGTIDGIEVNLLNWTTAGSANYYDVVLSTAAGTRIGSDKADGTQAIPTSDPGSTYDQFGGPADTWGATLTPAIVNSSDFGIEICYLATANNTTLALDHVFITVYYTPAGATTQMSDVIMIE